MENPKFSEKKKCIVWNRRTLLERYLFLVCVSLIIAFLVMIILLLCLQNISKKSEICLSHICKYEAGSILKNMDFTVDPCHNFYDFACGSYMKYENIFNEKIRTTTNLYNYMIYLAKVQLEKSENADDPPFYAKVRKYYQSCLNKFSHISDVIQELLNMTELDGWPVSEDYRSKSTMEDAAIIGFVYSGSELLFGIETERNHSHITIHKGYTTVYPDIILNKTKDNSVKKREQYIELINYVFIKLSLTQKDSKRYIEEMIDFETSLAKMQKVKRNDNSTYLTISALEYECPQISWKNMFKLFFKCTDHPEQYNDEYPMKITSIEYIKELCSFIGNSDKNKRIFYNLLIWNMLIRFLGRFDFIFRQFLSEIRIRFYIPKIPTNILNKLKWNACILDMEWYIKVGLDCITINSVNPDEDIKEVKSYAKNVSAMLREIFSDQDWFNDYRRNIMKSKVQNISYDIGYSKENVNLEFLNQVFKNINITNNYIQNILSVRKQMVINDIYNENLTSYLNKDVWIQPFSLTAYYINEKSEGKLEISLTFLHPPFYGYRLPKYINYGGIAVLIGHELSHGFHLYGYEDKKNISKEFLVEYKRRENCLINQYFQFPLEGNIMIDGNETLLDNFADNSGLTIAFRAYEKYLKHHGEEPYLPGLDFTNKQMFFISYAQLWCEAIDSMKETFESDDHSPGKYRVIVPLMNSPEFSKTFDCPINSYMNPEYKCKFWE